jgi:immune inhibitor A
LKISNPYKLLSFSIIIVSLLFSMPSNPYLPKDRPVTKIIFPSLVEKPEPIKAPVLGTKKALVLLVDFSDNTSIYSKDQIQALLFASTTNSLTGYYQEVSYGQFTLTGEVYGWFRAPHPYSYYVGDSFGISSPYPQNSQGLVEDVVALADGQIDFSRFDENNDGLVENLFIVHAGPGAEDITDPTQRRYYIWSHKWQLSDPAYGCPGTHQTQDGVNIDVFSVQPERLSEGVMITIGVFAHEFGHILGLPDLYDTDYSSSGLGWFCLMAAGSWAKIGNGLRGSSPVHPCVWAKYALGWLNPDALERGSLETEISATLPAAARTAKAYRLLANPNGVDWTTQPNGTGEYFMVENRYRTGYDQGLPGSGFLILHVDESQSGNSDETHPLVGIIQADRLGYALPADDRGSASTLWKDDTTGFPTFPDPNNQRPYSNLYDGTLSGVSIKDISTADSIMTAILRIEPFFLASVYAFPNPVVVQNKNEKLAIVYVPSDTAKLANKFPDFTIKIYNLAGEYIKTLQPDQQQRKHRLVYWDLKNEKGYAVASGLYFYLVELNSEGVLERSKGRFTIIR